MIDLRYRFIFGDTEWRHKMKCSDNNKWPFTFTVHFTISQDFLNFQSWLKFRNVAAKIRTTRWFDRVFEMTYRHIFDTFLRLLLLNFDFWLLIFDFWFLTQLLLSFEKIRLVLRVHNEMSPSRRSCKACYVAWNTSSQCRSKRTHIRRLEWINI